MSNYQFLSDLLQLNVTSTSLNENADGIGKVRDEIVMKPNQC